MIGDGIGGYNIVERLGIGGFATTYLAVDAHGGQVALKVLHQPDDPVARERFRRELDSTRRMNSQLVARMIDYDLEGKSPWIAFAYIPGRDLTEVLYDAPLPASRVSHLGLQLAAAICDLSDQGLVHRDLKPANVRVGANDSVTVVDLGIAWREEMSTLTANGAIGTLEYMAPETMIDADPNSAQDVWAFGLILAKLAGGRHPYGFAMQNTARFISALTNEQPDLRGVPWPWRQVCGVCLQFSPKNRPAPHELSALLETCSDLLELHPALPAMRPRERDAFLGRVPPRTRGEFRSHSLAWYETRVLLSECPGGRCWSLIALAEAQAGAGDFPAVRNAIRRIEDLWDSGLLEPVPEDETDAEDAFTAEATTADCSRDSVDYGAVLRAVAEVQLKVGDLTAAQATIERMQDSSSDKDSALKALAEVQAQAGEFSAAQATIERMPPSRRSDTALRVLADARADAGDMPGAEATIDRMRNPQDDFALLALARLQARAGDISAFEATIDGIRGYVAKDSALETLAGLQARAGEFSAAQTTIDRMRSPFERQSAQVALAVAQARTGDFASAQATIDGMLNGSQDGALLAVAQIQARAGEVLGAEANIARIRGDVLRDWGWMALADAQTRAGDFAAAQAIIERIHGSRFIKDALTVLAQAQTDAGDLSGVEVTLQRIDELWRSGALRALARVQLKVGDVPAAQVTIDRMQDSSSDKDSALKALAGEQAQAGEFSAAQATIERMTDGSDKQSALYRLHRYAVDHAMVSEAVVQAEAGNITAAEAAIREITDRHARDKALLSVAVAQGQAGDIPAAHATIGRILSRSVRAEALKALAGVQPSRS